MYLLHNKVFWFPYCYNLMTVKSDGDGIHILFKTKGKQNTVTIQPHDIVLDCLVENSFGMTMRCGQYMYQPSIVLIRSIHQTSD